MRVCVCEGLLFQVLMRNEIHFRESTLINTSIIFWRSVQLGGCWFALMNKTKNKTVSLFMTKGILTI